MSKKPQISPQELATLRGKLAEAEDMLRAIRAGEVDAIVVEGPHEHAPSIYTLKGAADPYRLLVEQMAEGALTVSSDGLILYCNAALARMIGRPRERLVGTAIANFVVSDDSKSIEKLFAPSALAGQAVRLKADDGAIKHAHVSVTPMTTAGEPVHCVVVTDLSRQELRVLHEAVVNASADAIYALRLDGTIKSWNAGAQRLYGYTAQEAIGRNIRMVIPEDQQENADELFRRVARGETERREVVRRTKSGAAVDIALSVSPIIGVDGRASGIATIARDVSKRKAAEAALRASEARLRNMGDNLPDSAIYEYAHDPSGIPRYLHVSDGIEKLTGIRAEELLRDGTLFARQIPPEYLLDILQAMERSRRDLTPFAMDVPIQHRDGELRWLRIQARLRRLPDGSVVSDGVKTDITARKRAEAKLLESEERFRVALGKSPTALFEQGLDLRYTWIYNPKLGNAADAVIGKTDADIMDPSCAPALEAIKRRVIATGQPERREVASAAHGAPMEYHDLYVEPRRDASGRIVGVICAATDITAAKNMRDALQLSDDRFRLALATGQTAAFTMDRERRITWAHSNRVGLRDAEMTNKTLFDIFARPDAERLDALYRKVIETGVGIRQDEDVQSLAKPTRQHLQICAEPLRDGDGEIVGLVAAASDVTSRKQAEAKLLESEQRTRLATEATEVGIWEWNVATDEILWDAQMFRIYGVATTRDGLLTYADWADFVHPEDFAEQDAMLRKQAREGGNSQREFRIRRPDGQVRYIQASETLRANAQGQKEWVVGTNLDVTERKHAEQALRASEAYSRSVFEASPDCVKILSLDGCLEWMNDNGLRLLEIYDFDAVRGKYWPDLWPTEARKTMEAALADARAGRGAHFSGFCPTCKGAPKWWDVMITAVPGPDGSPVRLVAASRDVTEKKYSEDALAAAKAEAERASEAKSKFLAAASHDLRQPVQSLTMLMAVLQRQVADKPKAAEAVAMANMAVKSLSGLLTGILDISKLDAGVVEPRVASVDLGALAEKLANEYRPRAAANGLSLRLASCALCGCADEEMLERILRNLLENALRYTASGGILLGVRRRGETVRIDVIDTGVGIPADKQAEIFEEFRQLNNQARDSSQGLGLGLSIVSRLARLLGAEVQVASRLGRGSRFSLSLRRDHAAPPAKCIKPVLGDPGGRVLVIEDNADLRRAFEVMLSEWGYTTLSVATAGEALARAEAEDWRFDAILADHRLGPGLNGAGAAAEILRRAQRPIPTLIVTGDTAKERIAEIHKSGFVMLHKPVEAADLRQRLAQALRGRLFPQARLSSGDRG